MTDTIASSPVRSALSPLKSVLDFRNNVSSPMTPSQAKLHQRLLTVKTSPSTRDGLENKLAEAENRRTEIIANRTSPKKLAERARKAEEVRAEQEQEVKLKEQKIMEKLEVATMNKQKMLEEQQKKLTERNAHVMETAGIIKVHDLSFLLCWMELLSSHSTPLLCDPG
jgi:hypothetical protein